MSNIEWVKKQIELCQERYDMISCPLLKDDKCTIYEKRSKCCRNYPQDNGYCALSECTVIDKENNTSESTRLCEECGARCCKKILVPRGVEITEEYIRRWLDVDCNECKELFSFVLEENK